MPDDDPAVTPEQEAQLRRILAQARHEEPVPVDVAARLDRVLEQLAGEERDPATDVHSVGELAARRRRRAARLLVAAAAVVVVGVGVGELTREGADDASSAGATAQVDAGREEASSGDAAADGSDDLAYGDSARLPEAPAPAEGTLAAPLSEMSTSSGQGPRPPVRLTEGGFTQQALGLRERPGVTSRAGASVPGQVLSRAESFVCDGADWGVGRLLPALYDGVPAVLAYRPFTGETQAVDLLRCGTGEVLRSTVLPVER